MSDIGTRLADIRGAIARACQGCGRDPSSVALVAVSKFHPASALQEAYEAGQREFGESYAQELVEKAEQLAHLPDIRWHFIGALQRNKAKFVVPHVHLLETVASVRLAEALEQRAQALSRTVDVLLQVNVGGEAQKSGCCAEEAAALLEQLDAFPSLRVRGLMTLPPFELEPEDTRTYFRALRTLRDRLGGPARLPHLSMGMSHDFEVAIAEGATIVRVGTAIFGDRAAPR
ncbi:MAG: YggS family pyridoxal phosphate-dependent enzyme [Proteobacteria bacterium]|jgi:pyridoxal phosphate enzyme (YggS family)|nr:YggS family pyridoxal phosphate-dependent enzyme [Pseudomonadota bacterium]NLN61529.1 YggS family pyridoxal phosphate-dependent enzyme [Myxococcales bacterium]